MRIEKLNLLRFGKFTDSSIGFGEHKEGQPDLHIVYGPNEAGKSTILAAYLDFLYGFPTKTPYNFIHNYKALKVGAVLSIDNELQEYRRVKRIKNSLLDGNDAPIDDKAILLKLAGLTKESYSSMFSLDDKGLEKGGESILASQGELGELLYSATTGVAQLSKSLIELRAKTAEFYDKSKKKFELADLKTRLKVIKDELDPLDTQASKYKKILKEREEAERQHKEIDAQNDKLKSEMQQLQLKTGASPQLISIQGIQAKLSPLQDLPEPPPSWHEDVRTLQTSVVKIETRENDIEKRLTELSDSISKIELDEKSLSALPQWEMIKDSHEKYRMASTGLPELEQDVGVCNREIANYLQKLDKAEIDNPETLLLNNSTQTILQSLIEDHPPLLTQLKVANQELLTATNQANELREKFVSEGGLIDEESTVATKSNSSAVVELEAAVKELQNQSLITQRQSAEGALKSLEDEIASEMLSLNPWVGDTQALQSLTIPHESDLNVLKQRRDALHDSRTKEEQKYQDDQNNLESLRSQLKADKSKDLIDDDESLRLREVRDKAWAEHKTTLEKNTADIFESAMLADDASQSARMQQTDVLAQLRVYSKDIIVTEDGLKQSELRLKELDVEDERLAKDMSQLIESISPVLNNAMSIEALTSWLESHADALLVVQKIKKAQRDVESIDKQASDACESLSRCLTAVSSANSVTSNVGDNDSAIFRLSELLKGANSVIKQEAALSGLHDQLSTGLRQVKIREEAVQMAEQELEAWTLKWNEVCSGCWIGEVEESSNPSVVQGIVSHLSGLDEQLSVQAKVLKKIEAHQKVVDAMRQLLVDLASDIGLEYSDISTDQLYREVQSRVGTAVENKSKIEGLEKQQRESQEQKDQNEESRSVAAKQIEKMCSHFNVSSLDEVELKLTQVKEKADLTEQYENVEQQLLGSLQVSSIADVFEALSGFDVNQAQLELEKLQSEAKNVGTELQQAHTARDHARKAVEEVGGDEAVARLMGRRANILLEIEEKATEYLQKHLALIAADAALKKYRDSHRSTMMQAASSAFSAISQGRYTGLDTIQDKASEKLIAIDKEGITKQSWQMSKGTRFQLYLALRVAGYHEYTRSRPTVPFIADDIMETSDDDRAACTFKVLGDMAKVGQVIYLTHHQHLCDIAKSVVPSTKIHHL